MFITRSLKSDKDLTDAKTLLGSWGIPEGVENTFSSTGLGVFDEQETLVGCMFLYFTNSPVVIFDNLCVSKDLSKRKKTDVIDKLVDTATNEISNTQVYKYILAEPVYRKSQKRLVEKYGFTQQKHDENKFWKKVA